MLSWTDTGDSRIGAATAIPLMDPQLQQHGVWLNPLACGSRGDRKKASVTELALTASVQGKYAAVMPSGCPGGHSTNSIR